MPDLKLIESFTLRDDPIELRAESGLSPAAAFALGSVRLAGDSDLWYPTSARTDRGRAGGTSSPLQEPRPTRRRAPGVIPGDGDWDRYGVGDGSYRVESCASGMERVAPGCGRPGLHSRPTWAWPFEYVHARRARSVGPDRGGKWRPRRKPLFERTRPRPRNGNVPDLYAQSFNRTRPRPSVGDPVSDPETLRNRRGALARGEAETGAPSNR